MRFVGGQRDFWRGSFGAAGGGLVGPIGPSIWITANRTTGTAPCNVFFEANALGFGLTSPVHDLLFTWTFSDPGDYTALPSDMPQGRDGNRATGAMAAHTFAEPGTYIVTLTVGDGWQTLSTAVSVQVADPDTVFAGADTFVVSPLGDWTEAPAAAQQFASLADAVSAAKAQGRRDARFLMRRGVMHDTRTLGDWTDSDFDSLSLGAFGPGRPPILTRPVTQIGDLSGELIVTDLALAGPFDPNVGGSVAEAGIFLSGGDFTTVHNVTVRGYAQGIVLASGAADVGLSNCRISDWASHGITLDGADRCAILGCEIAQDAMAQPLAVTGGPIRVGGAARRTVIWHNDLFSNAGGADHAPCIAWNADAAANARGLIGASRLEGGSPVLQIAPETPGTNAVPGVLDVEQTYILGTANSGTQGLVEVGYGGTRFRNAILVLPDVQAEGGADVPAFFTGGQGTPTTDSSGMGVTVQSCTFVDLRGPLSLIAESHSFATRDTDSTDHFGNWSECAALYYAPNLAEPIEVDEGMSEEDAFAARYVGRRTGSDALDKSYATPPGTAAIYAPLVSLTAAPSAMLSGEGSRDDFLGRIRGSATQIGAVQQATSVTLLTHPDGSIEIDGLAVGQATFEISGTTDQDAAVTLDVADFNGAPIFIGAAKATGSTAVGQTLTAVSGMFLYDPAQGTPVTTWSWRRGGDEVSIEPTYMVHADDSIVGLTLHQRTQNSRGAAESSAQVVDQPSYSETPVLPNATTLTSPGLLSSGTPTQALLFAKFVMPAHNKMTRLLNPATGGAFASGAPFIWGSHNSIEQFHLSALTSQVRYQSFTAAQGFTAGQEIIALVTCDTAVSSGTSVWQLRNPANGWHTRSQVSQGTSLALAQMCIGSDNNTGFWNTNLARLALWFDVAPDVTDPSVIGNFADYSSGALTHPSISHSLYGTPAFDFYGDAATWNSGTHQGALGAFTKSGGDFTDAA